LVVVGLSTSALFLVSFANIAELPINGVELGGLLVRCIVIVQDHRGWFLVGHRMCPVGIDWNVLTTQWRRAPEECFFRPESSNACRDEIIRKSLPIPL